MNKLIAISCGLFLTTAHNAMADELPSDAKIFCDQSNQECVAVGTVAFDCWQCTQPIAFVSHDGKKTWQQTERMDVSYSSAAYIELIKCSNDLKHCIVLGNLGYGHDRNEFGDALVLTSHDGGHQWIKQTFGCPMMSFSYAEIKDHYCNSSFSNCVAVGSCTKGMGDDRIYPMIIYLQSPNGWNWSNGISANIPYIKFSKVSCTGDNSNKLTCKADGDASDTGNKWWKISAISNDSGKNWTYNDHTKQEPYTYSKLIDKIGIKR